MSTGPTPFTRVEGPAVPLLLANVDTDVIIRIDRLTTLARNQLAPYALEALRYRADGTEDPACVLNDVRFRGAPVLLAGENFGCGSSREGAVWALQAIGLRCVIAPSFGDIFFSNCFQNGVLAVRLAWDEVQALAAGCSADGAPVRIDLEAMTLTGPDGTVRGFEVDPMRREARLHGLDDLGLTLREDERIRAWQAADRRRRPWVWTLPA